MYALDANSITGHKARARARFPSEHLAALIKPHLINSDKGEKDRGSERGRIGRNLQPRQISQKSKRERGGGGGAHYILLSEAGAVEENLRTKSLSRNIYMG